MAHGLMNETDMVWAGETPWHSLGVKLDGEISIEELASFPQFAWEAEKVQLQLPDGRRVDTYAMLRSDTKDIIGRSVGYKYHPLQFKQAFGFFNSFVSSKEAIIHTAGLINNGSRVWLLAKLPGEIRVHGDDVIGKYLLLSNSHDGSSPVQITFTPIRVVCQNTERAALMSASNIHAIRHTKGISQAINDAAKAMGIANSYYSDLEQAFQSLQRKQMTHTESVEYINTVFDAEFESSEKGSTRARNILEGVYELLITGKGTEMPGVRGTAWGAYNAVTEYIDHKKNYRSYDTALENIAFGSSGGNIKQKAFDLALAL